MKSTYKVVWTKQAKSDLDSLIDFLEKNWSHKEINNFVRKLDGRIDLISQKPLLFPVSKSRNNVHRSVLIPQISLYYRIRKSTIEILTLFDNRQHPGKLKF